MKIDGPCALLPYHFHLWKSPANVGEREGSECPEAIKVNHPVHWSSISYRENLLISVLIIHSVVTWASHMMDILAYSPWALHNLCWNHSASLSEPQKSVQL